MNDKGIRLTAAVCLTVLILVIGIAAGYFISAHWDDRSAGEAGNTGDIQKTEDTGRDGDTDGTGDEGRSIDINALRAENPDIYAWLSIPEAGIEEPILQNSEDINFYASHNRLREEDENGAVFTQMLNSRDFNDNVTVIYGHNGGGKAFSNLKVFADPGYFDNYPYIYIYTEDKKLVYKVFAAYESDDKLIVMFYGTQDDELYRIYLSNIEQYAGLSSKLDKTSWPLPSDKIITLSTGVEEREDRRFLVQAKLVESVDL